MIGAGGAARAVSWALAREGAKVSVSARQADRAASVARDLDVAAVAWPPAGAWDLIVNATPVGTVNHPIANHPMRSSDRPITDHPLDRRQVTAQVFYDLVYNPEVIIEAMQRFDARRAAAEQDEMKSIIAEREAELLRDPASPVGGNPKGDVTLVEFSDYNCPYCRRVAPLLAEAEASDPKLRIVYKEIPILGPDSLYAAKAVLAGRGGDVRDLLVDNFLEK